jgi:hypothetical protein
VGKISAGLAADADHGTEECGGGKWLSGRESNRIRGEKEEAKDQTKYDG